MPYPNYFPLDCPPESAGGCADKVYRLVANDPPTDDDFAPRKDEYPQLYASYTDKEKCQACGLSVQGTLDGAVLARDTYRRFRNRRIAAAELAPEHGEISPEKKTGANAHRTWWPYDGLDAKTLFQVVDEQ